jgi:UDP-GlcNAc:undecaprenyl-phosphate GlcNAc-1-phosphate transferase
MLLALLAACSASIVAVMVRVGALDHPVARSSHTAPTPKGGGVGIAAAFVLGIALVHPGGAADIILAAAAACLAIASFADDVLQWPFWLKLAAQIAGSVAILAAGLAPHSLAIPGFGLLPLGVLAPAFALAWLLFVTNAVNFMDGLNGLAAGSAAAGCLVLASLAGPGTAWPEAVIVAAVAGFLPFNYPAARIFMGDVGSQFLGFLLAGLALRHAGDRNVSAILPLSLSPMLIDVAFTLLRRARAGERLTQAHRGHLYQVAQRAGVPAWLVTAIYWAMAGWGGWCGAKLNAASLNAAELHANITASGHTVRWLNAAWLIAAWLIAAFGPFAVWAAYVRARAGRAGLRNW